MKSALLLTLAITLSLASFAGGKGKIKADKSKKATKTECPASCPKTGCGKM